ncbi:MAG: hypothetical protein AAGF31_10025 [Planctomycetota bacterium]
MADQRSSPSSDRSPSREHDTSRGSGRPENGANRGKGKGGVAYLTRTLQMNPLYEGDAIIALRSKALRLTKPTKETAGADAANRRTQALNTLAEIREKCWSAPPEELLSRLDAIPTDHMPDVQAAAERLKVVAQNRAKLPELSQHKHFDGEFFSCLKQILAASPRETSVLREQVLASFRAGKLRKRGRRMIKLIEKELPELYRLEADWFASLLQQKTVAGGNEAYSSDYRADISGGDSSTAKTWAVGGFTIWIIYMVVKYTFLYFQNQ